MDRGDGHPDRLLDRRSFDRRSFGRLALGGLAGAAAATVAGGAFAATEEDTLHDYVTDSQDSMRLLRRISGLHTERWQDHFSSISQDAILVKVNDRVLHYWGGTVAVSRRSVSYTHLTLPTKA